MTAMQKAVTNMLSPWSALPLMHKGDFNITFQDDQYTEIILEKNLYPCTGSIFTAVIGFIKLNLIQVLCHVPHPVPHPCLIRNNYVQFTGHCIQKNKKIVKFVHVRNSLDIKVKYRISTLGIYNSRVMIRHIEIRTICATLNIGSVALNETTHVQMTH